MFIYLPVLLSIAPQTLEPASLERIVVTGARPLTTIELVKDPKAPQQPLPAHDGGDYLKAIPGFSLIRKGGTSGDPVFRGAAGSRLTITSDDQMVLGGCSSRMDPPTAYINPQNYDQIRIIKGPQTVLYGPTAGTVLFERSHDQVRSDELPGRVSLVAGSWGRREGNVDYQVGGDVGFWRVAGSLSEADHYQDGAGESVHSAYQRWAIDTQWGWTPNHDTLLVLSVGTSGGEAAYADRGMDGSLFDRNSASLRWQQSNLAPWLMELDSQVYFGYIDHVMDNYSLREFTPSMAMPHHSASNPDRYSRGGRMVATLDLAWFSEFKLGIDHQHQVHRDRSSMNQLQLPYQHQPRRETASVAQYGVFLEGSVPLTAGQQVIGGLRWDHWRATDEREFLGMPTMPQPNPTANMRRNDDLYSAFVRWEYQHQHQQWSVGIGRAERFPDFWELIGNRNQSPTSASAFHTAPELTHQLDIGYHVRKAELEWLVHGFYNRIDRFILIENGQHRQPDLVRNIATESWGTEAMLTYRMTPQWLLDATLAYTHGSNLSDRRPLAQQPPLELKFGAEYRQQDWTFAGLWRVVAQQNRVAIGQGNIVGNDFKTTAGFGVLAINAHWQVAPRWQISFGIDNLLDHTYAEHLSTAGAMVAGFEQTAQVHEPGRTFWLKLDYQ